MYLNSNERSSFAFRYIEFIDKRERALRRRSKSLPLESWATSNHSACYYLRRFSTEHHISLVFFVELCNKRPSTWAQRLRATPPLAHSTKETKVATAFEWSQSSIGKSIYCLVERLRFVLYFFETDFCFGWFSTFHWRKSHWSRWTLHHCVVV